MPTYHPAKAILSQKGTPVEEAVAQQKDIRKQSGGQGEREKEASGFVHFQHSEEIFSGISSLIHWQQ